MWIKSEESEEDLCIEDSSMFGLINICNCNHLTKVKLFFNKVFFDKFLKISTWQYFIRWKKKKDLMYLKKERKSFNMTWKKTLSKYHSF